MPPRKAAAAATADGGEAQAPRRSSRIKVQPKTEAPAKKVAKPRTKKAKEPKEDAATDGEKEGGEKESAAEGAPAEKPKSAARGRKRKAAEKEEDEEDDKAEAEPPAKKVRLHLLLYQQICVPDIFDVFRPSLHPRPPSPPQRLQHPSLYPNLPPRQRASHLPRQLPPSPLPRLAA